MTSSKFMIGPIPEGMRKDVKPWALVENAFEVLTNAYQFRGRIIRRKGYKLLGRLTISPGVYKKTPVMGLKTRELFVLGQQQLIAFDTTNAYEYNAGSQTFNELPSIMPTVWTGTNSQFFNIANYAGGFWATNFKPGLHGAPISTITKAVIGAGTPLVTTVAPHGFSTGQTVVFINVSGMPEINGLSSKITVLSATTFSLDDIDTSGFTAGGTGGIALNSQVSVTGQDGIRYYGTLTINDSWANYNPPIDTNNALAGCLFIFPYRGYLVFLNTWEGNTIATLKNYSNRARWTQIGTPYYSTPVPETPSLQNIDVKAARDDLFGRGGANDAPTTEAIVGAAFIRDVLVVYFERSTWRLRFVNNAQNPFVWERVNVELGSSCPNSTIPFDKGVMTLSNRGILISDGNDTNRFDEKIPDDVFHLRLSQEGYQRVSGIRTFRTRLSMWTYPDEAHNDGIFPDKVLVYNYETQAWAYFDDCFTCFGYFYPASSDLGDRWIDLTSPWSSYNDKTSEVNSDNAGLECVIAGNQQGFVLQLEEQSAQNSPSLYIDDIDLVTNRIKSPNHNLPNGSWIKITGVTGTTMSDGVSLDGRNFKIANGDNDPNYFALQEYDPIDAGLANGSSFIYIVNYKPIYKGSVQVNVGSIVFKDVKLDGTLTSNVLGTLGTIDYKTGVLSLTFSPALGGPTAVIIRVVSSNLDQGLEPVFFTGVYDPDTGFIAKISNLDIQTKIFNFFKDDSGTRLSKIDFYVDKTANGQFECNAFGDSSDIPMNSPLKDNPQSNVVLTTKNPYQVGSGDQTIFRLFCDASSQTVQLQFTLNDRQMAVDSINDEDIQLLSMMFTLSSRGRLV